MLTPIETWLFVPLAVVAGAVAIYLLYCAWMQLLARYGLVCLHNSSQYLWFDRNGIYKCRCGKVMGQLKNYKPKLCALGHPMDRDGTCVRCEDYAWDARMDRIHGQ